MSIIKKAKQLRFEEILPGNNSKEKTAQVLVSENCFSPSLSECLSTSTKQKHVWKKIELDPGNELYK